MNSPKDVSSKPTELRQNKEAHGRILDAAQEQAAHYNREAIPNEPADPKDRKPMMQHLYEQELQNEPYVAPTEEERATFEETKARAKADHARRKNKPRSEWDTRHDDPVEYAGEGTARNIKEVAEIDLDRVRKDPQKYADMIGAKAFVAMYPELANQVRFVPEVGGLTGPREGERLIASSPGSDTEPFTPVDLRKIPNEPAHGKMIGRLDPATGKAVIEPATALVQGAMDDAQAIIDVEMEAQAALRRSEQLVADAEEGLEEAVEADERILALEKLVRDKMLLERGQIVAVIMAYAEDCEERAEQLELSGHRERKRLRKTGHVQQAEEVREMQKARAAAFKVRAAISADLAFKIETGWGRKEDGSVQDKPNADDNDLMKESARMNREAAHLKTV